MFNRAIEAERRIKPRYQTECRCWVERDSMTLFGTVTNLSHNGFFIRTLPLIDVGAVIDIKLNLAKGIVTARGTVKWQNKSDAASPFAQRHPPGMGISLDELLGGHEILHRFFKRTSLIPERD